MEISQIVLSLVSPIFTAVIAAVGSYFATKEKVAVLSTKMDNMNKKIDELNERQAKYNNLQERVFRMEEQIKTLFRDIEKED